MKTNMVVLKILNIRIRGRIINLILSLFRLPTFRGQSIIYNQFSQIRLGVNRRIMGFRFVNGRGVGDVKLRLVESDKGINGSIVGVDREI